MRLGNRELREILDRATSAELQASWKEMRQNVGKAETIVAERVYVALAARLYPVLHSWGLGPKETDNVLNDTVRIVLDRHRSIPAELVEAQAILIADDVRAEYERDAQRDASVGHATPAEMPDADLKRQERKQSALKTLAEILPSQEFRVFECRFFKRMSIMDTAKALGIEPGNVNVTYFRARKRIEGWLRSHHLEVPRWRYGS